MVSLSRSKAIVALGKRLVAQLNDGRDLLGAWMAHMIAERIHAVETAPPEGKAAAEEACAKSVLELWEHREAMHQSVRPLIELDPILRILQSLDVEGDDFRYYPRVLRAAENIDADEDVKRWLELAIGTDNAARQIIRLALRRAADGIVDEAASWVELARIAGAEDGAEGILVNFILDTNEKYNTMDVDSLKKKLSGFENLISLAQTLADEVRSEIIKLDDR